MPTELESTITHVTVFRAGAIVTREATLTGAHQNTVLAFIGLPTVLDDASVRVRLVAKESETWQPTDVRVEVVLPPIGESIQDGDSVRLVEAARIVESLRGERDRIEQEIALFSRLSPTLIHPQDGGRPLPAPTAAWRETLSWQRQETERRQQEIAELDQRIKTADEARARLERSIRAALAERDGRANRVSKRVTFVVQGSLAAGTAVQLEYRVPGARWAPSYVVRVARDGKTAELGLRAMVAQNTGERWSRVKLALSTAELLRAQDVPDLKSLRIGRVLPRVQQRAWRELPGDTDRLFAALDAVMGRNPSPPALTEATVPPLVSQEVAPPVLQRSSAVATPAAAPRGVLTGSGFMTAPGTAMANEAAISRDALTMTGAAMPSSLGRSEVPAARGSRPRLGRAGGRSSDDSAMAIPEEAELVAGEATEVTVVFALKQLRYSEIKVVGFRGDDRGKLRPLSHRDRLGEADDSLTTRAFAMMSVAMQHAAWTDSRTMGIPIYAGANYRYDSDGVIDVPSDGEIHNIALLERRADMRSVYVVVPRESTDVVRIATMKNPLQAPLLSGEAEIYLDDEFLVNTTLQTVPAGGELTIGLGVEPAVKVARRVKYEEETDGFLRGSRGLDHEVEIEVSSRLGSAIDVDVRERVPVPLVEEKEIVVEVKSVTPPWEDYKQIEKLPIRGGHRWRFSLDPGAKKTLSFAYRVKIDAKAEVVGGNRRERY